MKTKTLTLLTLVVISSIAMAQIINVPGDQPTIQAGIDVSQSGDTVLVEQGAYFENIDFNGKAITVMSNYLNSLDSADLYNTIIDGGQPTDPDNASVVYFTSGEDSLSIICGFTIQNGTGTYPDIWGSRSGGGIYCVSSGPKILHNRIINNSVSYTLGALGGGICSDTSFAKPVIIRHNLIANNYVYNQSTSFIQAEGAGICIGGDAIITHNIIKQNTAKGWPYGGGLYLWKCAGLISHNYIVDNLVDTDLPYGMGGGIYIVKPYPGLTISQNNISGNKCIGLSNKGGAIGAIQFETTEDYFIDGNQIYQNEAMDGGGISISGSYNCIITNNVIQNNDALDDGGGIHLWLYGEDKHDYALRSHRQVMPTKSFGKSKSFMQLIVNNTISNNNALSVGGGIASELGVSDFLAFNNIIYENSAVLGELYLASNVSNAYLFNNNLDTNLISGPGTWTGGNNIFVDPEFDSSGYHLLVSSDCIEAGINTLEINGDNYYCPEFDIDGEIRPFNLSVDIGADEYYPVTGIVELHNSNDNIIFQNFPNPFTNYITISFELKSDSYINLSIFDMAGKKIQTLISGNLQPGIHKTDWDASRLENGIYFCSLKTSEGIQTRKIIKL